MAISSTIQFGDNNIKKYSREYKLVNLKCHFKRNDDRFRPTSDVTLESVLIDVIVPASDDRFLFEWYISGQEQTGRILTEISDPAKDNEPVWKEILFDEAVCFSMGEHYVKESLRRTLRLGLVASRIIMSDIEF